MLNQVKNGHLKTALYQGGRKKALETWVCNLKSEPHLVYGLIQKKMFQEAWAGLKYYLRASLSAPSEHLFQLPPALLGSVFWYHCSSRSDFRCSWLFCRRMLAGQLGERPLWRKSPCCMCCAWRGYPSCVHFMWRQVGKRGRGPYTEELDKKWKSQIRHGMWNKTPKW